MFGSKTFQIALYLKALVLLIHNVQNCFYLENNIFDSHYSPSLVKILFRLPLQIGASNKYFVCVKVFQITIQELHKKYRKGL